MNVEMPDGTIIENVPNNITQSELLRRYNLMQKQPQEKGFLSNVKEALDKRFETAVDIYGKKQEGVLSAPEAALGMVGRVGLGGINDIVANAIGSGLKSADELTGGYGSALLSRALSSVANVPTGTEAGTVGSAAAKGVGTLAQKYEELAGEYPRTANILESIGNVAFAAPVFQSAKMAAPAVKTGAKAAALPFKAVIGGGVKTARGIDEGILSPIAHGIGRTIGRANLPKEAKALGDAEALFVKSLVDEGVTVEDALKSLEAARSVGATPSVSVTASIPAMKTQGYLMARGSSGSKVAAKAVEDITERQIPMLNERIIKEAVGKIPKSAEEYGRVVSQLSKSAIDRRKDVLASRAKPFYQESIGVDKSLSPSNEKFQSAMKNPLVVKALEEARKDPYTLTNVFDELGRLGVAVDDIQRLPYNSTVTLHAARTHLRQLGDAAFSAGEKQKGIAIKTAIKNLDDAIESTFPSYKTARRIYSEDSGALRALTESPVGQMAAFAEGDYSKIANAFMQKDPGYIKKTLFGLAKSGINENKMRESIAGAFLKRQLEEARKNGLRFSDTLFKNEGNVARLEAILGKEKTAKMKKVQGVIDDLIETKSIPQQSITAAAQSIKEGGALPYDKTSFLAMMKNKISPRLFDIVQKDPVQAARFNELMFTDEGFNLLKSLSPQKKLTFSEMEKVLKSFVERFK